MAKQTEPKNKGLEADVLKAAGQPGTTTAAEGTGENKVNQDAVKNEAEQLGDQAQGNTTGAEIKGTQESTTGPVAQGVQLPSSNLEPVKGAAQATDDEKADYMKAQNTARVAPLPNAPFTVPAYLNEHPVQNQEEIDAIAQFLQMYRNGKASAVAAQVTEPDEHAALLKQYGEGYVKAKKGNQEQVFTALTWSRMNGNSNQDGWRQVVKTPPEVEALKKSS